MGMFDSLIVQCPHCNNNVEFQSKAGECCLTDYNINDCPPNILGDLNDQFEYCKNCGKIVFIRVETIARIE